VLGFRNSSLVLDSQTGVVTVSNDNHGFDREESAGTYHDVCTTAKTIVSKIFSGDDGWEGLKHKYAFRLANF
jgi:hypothetical protein